MLDRKTLEEIIALRKDGIAEIHFHESGEISAVRFEAHQNGTIISDEEVAERGAASLDQIWGEVLDMVEPMAMDYLEDELKGKIQKMVSETIEAFHKGHVT